MEDEAIRGLSGVEHPGVCLVQRQMQPCFGGDTDTVAIH